MKFCPVSFCSKKTTTSSIGINHVGLLQHAITKLLLNSLFTLSWYRSNIHKLHFTCYILSKQVLCAFLIHATYVNVHVANSKRVRTCYGKNYIVVQKSGKIHFMNNWLSTNSMQADYTSTNKIENQLLIHTHKLYYPGHWLQKLLMGLYITKAFDLLQCKLHLSNKWLDGMSLEGKP